MPNTKSSQKDILLTGANGQLGQCLQLVFNDKPDVKVHSYDKNALNIEDSDGLERLFQNTKFDYCINCAAYTNVEKAESERDAAFAINALASENLAKLCAKYNSILIFPSTDYVFDGTATEPYLEEDATGPINVYGDSKLAGEQAIRRVMKDYFIVRTSWLYSEFGHNFYKSMLANFEKGGEYAITTEQTGTPTNAHDLAAFIADLIQKKSNKYGLYHYSNAGEATWYDFAQAIYSFSPRFKEASLGTTNHYTTFAARPAYSVLSKNKCVRAFGTNVPHWKVSLNRLMNRHL